MIPATASFRHSADQPVLESVYHFTTSLLDPSFRWNDNEEKASWIAIPITSVIPTDLLPGNIQAIRPCVIPAKAGIQKRRWRSVCKHSGLFRFASLRALSCHSRLFAGRNDNETEGFNQGLPNIFQ